MKKTRTEILEALKIIQAAGMDEREYNRTVEKLHKMGFYMDDLEKQMKEVVEKEGTSNLSISEGASIGSFGTAIAFVFNYLISESSGVLVKDQFQSLLDDIISNLDIYK